jgi:phosphoribosylanthranilate isomerase
MMVKICGITNLEDAVAAVEGGASALGFNFWRRSPRYVTPETARGMIDRLAATVWKVGVFVDEDAVAVSRIAQEAGLDIVQLHGQETARSFPQGTRVWKAVRIRDGFDIAQLDAYPSEAVLLDGPASGETFDWALAARVSRKLIIAGGLDANNVRAAIERARPWGVDACSRLESAPGRKDQTKMSKFLKAALAS